MAIEILKHSPWRVATYVPKEPYDVSAVGRPPDLVVEIASKKTVRQPSPYLAAA
ncbi:MAG: hypothetical protein ACRDG4_17935 [Chloroflexota bacterium]